jgi:predicted transglutaminase-like cysteine proteinase
MTKRPILLIAAAAMAALFAGPAAAQLSMPGVDLTPDSSRRLTPEERERLREIDKNYKATLKQVPDKKQSYDPWAGARDDASSKSGHGRR